MLINKDDGLGKVGSTGSETGLSVEIYRRMPLPGGRFSCSKVARSARQGEFPQACEGVATIEVGVGVPGVEPDRPREVFDRLEVVAHDIAGQAAPVVRRGSSGPRRRALSKSARASS